MAHNPVGFKGSVDQVGWAQMMALGTPRFLVGGSTDWQPSVVAGADRTVRLATGVGYGCGVRDSTNTTSDISFAANASGSDRYDLLVATWTWLATSPFGTVAFEVIEGTPGAGIPAATVLTRTPGGVYKGLVALVKVRPGVGAFLVSDLTDARVWGGTAGPLAAASTSSSILPLLDVPGGGAVAGVDSPGTLRVRREDGSWDTYRPSVSNNAGTDNVLAGTAPPAGAQLLFKTFYGPVGLSSAGDGTVFFPGGAFPNGVVAVTVNHVSQGGLPSNDLEFVPWNVGLSSTNLRCYGPSGAVFGGTGVACVLTLIGW